MVSSLAQRRASAPCRVQQRSLFLVLPAFIISSFLPSSVSYLILLRHLLLLRSSFGQAMNSLHQLYMPEHHPNHRAKFKVKVDTKTQNGELLCREGFLLIPECKNAIERNLTSVS